MCFAYTAVQWCEIGENQNRGKPRQGKTKIGEPIFGKTKKRENQYRGKQKQGKTKNWGKKNKGNHYRGKLNQGKTDIREIKKKEKNNNKGEKQNGKPKQWKPKIDIDENQNRGNLKQEKTKMGENKNR